MADDRLRIRFPRSQLRRRQPGAGTVVMKFGGTSVAGRERLRAVAQRLVAAREAGHRVVAVLSAMGDTTDDLFGSRTRSRRSRRRASSTC